MNKYKGKKIIYLFSLLLIFLSCQPEQRDRQTNIEVENPSTEINVNRKDTLPEVNVESKDSLPDINVKKKDTSTAVNVKIQNNDTLPNNILKLIKAYPDFIIGGTQDSVIWFDGSKMVFDDGKNDKSYEQNLDSPDISDQFLYSYPKGLIFDKAEKNHDPGRIRYEAFFYKMYGKNKKEVEDNLVEIIWLPKSAKQRIKVTKINDIAQKIIAISNELERIPKLQKYLENIGGTFNWRLINGTNRISTHSFGMTIDLNTKYANYWQWDCKCKDENVSLLYKNEIPMEIVAIFEKYGFIWGGKWYHYDTMHFEYRPELLI